MTKRCTQCSLEKPITEFYIHRYSNRKDAIRSWCKECSNKFSKKNSGKYADYYKKYCAEKYYRRKNEYWTKYGFSFNVAQKYGFENVKQTFEKYEYQCAECEDEKDLNIHHIDHRGSNYIRMGLEANNDPNNLMLLCRRCHASLHAQERRGIPTITE